MNYYDHAQYHIDGWKWKEFLSASLYNGT